MDIVKFRNGKENFGTDTYFDVAEIYINETNLLDLIKQTELPFAIADDRKNIAGTYAGIETKYFYEDMISALNKSCSRQNIYDCTCGCMGCWPLSVKIIVANNTVIWTDFNNHLVPHWDWSKLHFIFDKKQFINEVNKLKFYINNP